MKKDRAIGEPTYNEAPPTLNHAASVHAPVIFFETAPTFGTYDGNVRVTLETSRLYVEAPGAVQNDRIMVAHLRCSPGSARQLIRSLQSALDLLESPADEVSARSALN